MFKLHVVQAAHGDCLVVEFGSPQNPRFMLIDGGPSGTYEDHLRGVLRTFAKRKKRFDVVVLSHVDNDHVLGLLDLLAELEQQRADGVSPLISVADLWHNAFDETIGRREDILPRLKRVVAQAGKPMRRAAKVLTGIQEGHDLRGRAAQLRIPVNKKVSKKLISLDTVPRPIRLANLTLQVVGPTQKNLQRLQEEWLAWLQKHEAEVARDPRVAAMADRTTPNLSSIVLLCRAEGKTLLLTGDARGDHVLDGLKAAGLLSEVAPFHVDVLKLPHHGSNRNVDAKFFESVTADIYLISADGRNDNPDLDTLTWIVQAAKKQGRRVTLLATNDTTATRQLAARFAPRKHGYSLKIMSKARHSIALDLAT